MPAPSLDHLRTISLFQNLGQEELADVAGRFVAAAPGKGGVLFEVGQQTQGLYVLTLGEVTLQLPNEAPLSLRPPAVIGELGGMAGAVRNARAVVAPGSEVWQLTQASLQALFASAPAVGIRLLSNLVATTAHKVDCDQRRLADMRRNLITTQKALKGLRDVVLEAKDSPVLAQIHGTLDQLIVNNRRVNYRVAPPPTMAARLRLDVGVAPVVELSRSHITVIWPDSPSLARVGTWISGVADLAGQELVVSGTIIRSGDRDVTIELDLLVESSVAVLEGFLTRVQLLDILV